MHTHRLYNAITGVLIKSCHVWGNGLKPTFQYVDIGWFSLITTLIGIVFVVPTMSFEVDTPEPPTLRQVDPNEYEDAEVVGGTDYKRDEISQYLEQGAWEQAWNIWLEQSEMDEHEFQIMFDLDMIAQFDFFWDSFAERVGYHAPGIPEDWKERDFHPDLNSWARVSSINAGLTELGQVVSDVLKDEYIEWESDYEPPDDLPDF